MTSVGEDFPKEQQRVRELLKLYDAIPNGAMMLRQVLDRAEKVTILASYQELKGCE